MDAELRSLVQRFQELQKQETANRINERNVIEIVNIIHKKKKLVDILYTSDGKEFLTWDKLRREMVDEVYANHGRLNLVDLPSVLNVDMTYIERALSQVLDDANGGLVLHMGELLSTEYLDAMILDAAEQLKESGSLSVSEFAKSRQLSSVYVGELLLKAIADKRLHAEHTENALYTKTFVHSQRSLLRSALVAHTRQVSISSIIQRYDLNPALVPSILEQLAHELPGDVDGGAAGQYTPTVFTQERLEQVTNLYRSNGYVAYAALVKMGIANPKKYLELTFNPPSASASPTTSDSKKGTARSKTAKKAVPVASSGPVRASDEFPLAGHILSGAFLSDKALATLLIESVDALISGEAKHVNLSEALPNVVDMTVDGEILLPRVQELFPALQDSLCVHGSILVPRTIFDTLRPSLTAVLSEEYRSFRTSTAGDALSSSKKSAATDKRGGETSERKFNPLTSKKVQALVSATTKVSQPDDVADLLSQWDVEIGTILQEVMAQEGKQAQTAAKRQRAEHQSRCAEQWSELCVLAKGVEWCEKELPAADQQTIQRHVLQHQCLALAQGVILDEAMQAPELLDRVQTAMGSNLKAGIQCLDKKKQPPLVALADAVQGRSVSAYMEQLESMASNGDTSLSCFHPMNKKAERDLATAMREKLKTQLTAAHFTCRVADSAVLFADCCAVIVAALFRVVIHVSGKAVSGVCARIMAEAEVGTLDVTTLEAAKSIIVSALTSSAASLSEDQITILEQLRSSVLSL